MQENYLAVEFTLVGVEIKLPRGNVCIVLDMWREELMSSVMDSFVLYILLKQQVYMAKVMELLVETP
jgi:hypothetical protein